MYSNPLVAVIVNNFKGTDKLKVCLSSINETDYPNFEMIVSDCITTGIEFWIKANFPEVKLIHSDKDIGPAAARNAGLFISNPNSKYVVFVDNDTKMHPQWLRNLVNSLESSPEIGAAQPLLMKMDSPEKVDSCGGFFDRIGYACLPPFLDERLNHSLEDFDICYCEGVTILRRCILDNFNNVNEAYDPDYFQHWEDIDFCWQVMLSGNKVVLVPTSIVFHERGVSAGLGKQSAKLVFLNTRNRVTTLMKDYDLWNLAKYLPVLVFFEFSKALVLFRTNSSHAVSTYEGLFWSLKNIKLIWRKRVQVQFRTRKISDSKIEKLLVKPSFNRLLKDFRRHYNQ
jgi:GT2 family glycosyltransferase